MAQEHADRDVPSEGAVDFYRLLRIDPDAPQELVAEAYWCLAGDIRDRLSRREGAERELDALNKAYAVLVDPVKREAYDETVRPRHQDYGANVPNRRETKRPSPLARLLVRPRPSDRRPVRAAARRSRGRAGAHQPRISGLENALFERRDSRLVGAAIRFAGRGAFAATGAVCEERDGRTRFVRADIIPESPEQPPDFLTKEHVSGIPEERK